MISSWSTVTISSTPLAHDVGHISNHQKAVYVSLLFYDHTRKPDGLEKTGDSCLPLAANGAKGYH